MKRIIAFAAVLFLYPVLFLAAVCTADGPSGEAGAGSAVRVTRNVKAAWTGTMHITGYCGGGFPEVRVLNVGEGFMTHAGASENAGEFCMNLANGVAVGTMVTTAANGDAFYMDVTLQSFGLGGPAGTWEQTETIKGGTGRFVGATGAGTSHGEWIATSETSFSWDGTSEGTIRY